MARYLANIEVQVEADSIEDAQRQVMTLAAGLPEGYVLDVFDAEMDVSFEDEED